MEPNKEFGPNEYGDFWFDYINAGIDWLKAAAPAILSICIIGSRLFKDTVRMWDSHWNRTQPKPVTYQSNLSQITI